MNVRMSLGENHAIEDDFADCSISVAFCFGTLPDCLGTKQKILNKRKKGHRLPI